MHLIFENPFYLYGLFFIPLIIFFHFYGLRSAKGKSVNFANFDAIARIKGIDLYSKSILIPIINVFLILGFVLSLSSPVLYMEMDATEFSYVIAMDSSESMGAEDFSPSRLEAAKIASNQFVNSVPSSNIGVISFSGNSYVEQELTTEKALVKNAIEGIEVSDIGGTDIYEAVSSSLSLLSEEENKAVLLLSDGQINTGSIESVISLAKKENAVIHTFGIGTLEGGETKFGISKLDEDTLKALAHNTLGEYFPVSNESSLLSSFDKIVPLTRRYGPINLELYLLLTTLCIFVLKQFLIDVIKIRV